MTVRGRRGAVLLFALALVAVVLEGASLPHVHDEPGWHNLEHDLGSLVALAAAGVPAAVAAAPVPLTTGHAVQPPAPRGPRSAPWLHRAPRAPPAR
jgi:hypothetical protein